MHAVNPYSSGGNSNKSKAEILARYRPIAPKPEAAPSGGSACGGESNSNALPESIRKSAFLRDVWPHLQARPTRTRKRGRSCFPFPVPIKRARTCLQGLISPAYHHHHQHLLVNSAASAANNWPANYPNGLPQIPIRPDLAPLQCSLLDIQVTASTEMVSGGLRGIDLNRAAESPDEELDFTPQLQGGGHGTTIENSSGSSSHGNIKVSMIKPQPIRLVGSSIFVGCIMEVRDNPQDEETVLKSAEDVEKEVEAEALPVVILDMNNKVRLANAAYKQMVGQPKCHWLDYFPEAFSTSKRMISGEVVLRFSPDSTTGSRHDVPISLSNRFTCWVRIEWDGSNGQKNEVRAFCDAVKLACQSKDYFFEWRFHITTDINSSSSACPP